MDEKPQDLDPTKRFSNRVAYYKQYRPGYPREIISYLETEIGLSAEMIVADVGSGTGLLARLFLAYGNTVYAVEPNEQMRAVAEEDLRRYQGFKSVDGTAENTTLEEASIDLITAGQAFHWFRMEEARQEFRRILRAGGSVALVYNSWNVADSPVTDDYRDLIDRYGIDVRRVTRQNRIGEDMTAFFGGGGPSEARFDNPQRYDFAALRGRALSSSYAPLAGHPNHEPLVEGLRRLFERYATDGVLLFPYETTVFLGRLDG